MNNYQNPARKKIIIGLIIFGVVSLIAIIVAIFFRSQEDTIVESDTTPKTTTYTDTYSGETVTDTENKTPESYGSDSKIVLLGTSKLLQYGFTDTQIRVLREFTTQYSVIRTNEKPITEATINFDTYSQTISEESGANITSFTMYFNRNFNEGYHIVTTRANNTDLSIIIYKADKTTVVFNSATQGGFDGI